MSLNKELYMKIRGEEEIPLSLFYKYWLDRNGTGINLEEFEQLFPQFMQYQMVHTKNGVKFVDFRSIIERVYKHFDEKFGI